MRDAKEDDARSVSLLPSWSYQQSAVYFSTSKFHSLPFFTFLLDIQNPILRSPVTIFFFWSVYLLTFFLNIRNKCWVLSLGSCGGGAHLRGQKRVGQATKATERPCLPEKVSNMDRRGETRDNYPVCIVECLTCFTHVLLMLYLQVCSSRRSLGVYN